MSSFFNRLNFERHHNRYVHYSIKNVAVKVKMNVKDNLDSNIF